MPRDHRSIILVQIDISRIYQFGIKFPNIYLAKYFQILLLSTKFLIPFLLNLKTITIEEQIFRILQ